LDVYLGKQFTKHLFTGKSRGLLFFDIKMKTFVSYELSTQRTGPQENMVISKMKYYMNDYLNAAMHIQVRLNGILITPPRLSLSGSTELVVHGHLSGATSLVIGSESSVTLKNTAHTDNNMANHFTFDDLVIEDGGELITEEISSSNFQTKKTLKFLQVR